MRIAIVGGGVAGLALAAGLDPTRWEIAVYDDGRHAYGPPTDYGIWPDGRRVLTSLGLERHVASSGVGSPGTTVLNHRGQVLHRQDRPVVWMVPRPRLVELLRAAAQQRARVTQTAMTSDDVLAMPAEVVVGADGARSVVRTAGAPEAAGDPGAPGARGVPRARGVPGAPGAPGAGRAPDARSAPVGRRPRGWGPGHPARFSSAIVIRGVCVENAHRRPPAGLGHTDAAALTEWWGRGMLIGRTPHAGGGTNWFVSFHHDPTAGPHGTPAPAPAPPTTSALPGPVTEWLDLARTSARAFPAEAQQILADATPELASANRLLLTDRVASLVSGRAVLVGDAAHAMAPNLGRGANEALLDAACLARELNGCNEPTDIPAALRRYDRARLLRTRATAVASNVVMAAALTERAQPLRDRVLAPLAALHAGRPFISTLT